MSINGMKQQQGEKRADFIERCRMAQREAAATLPQPKARKRRSTINRETYEDRLDDLGHSPDY